MILLSGNPVRVSREHKKMVFVCRIDETTYVRLTPSIFDHPVISVEEDERRSIGEFMGLTRAEERTQNKHCRCIINLLAPKFRVCTKKVPFFTGSASPSEQKSESDGRVVNVLRTWIMEFLSRSRVNLR